MRRSMEMLQRFGDDPSFDRSRVVICYTMGGMPGTRACVTLDRVTRLANTYLVVNEGAEAITIPYHRIEEILLDSRVEWKKGAM